MALSFAHRPDDTEQVRLEKTAVFLIAGSCCAAGVVWAGMYLVTLGWVVTTALPAIYTLVVGTALVVSHLARDHRPALYAQVFCIIQITALIQWSIGGAFDSGFVLAWALIGPITALAFLPPRKAVGWLVLYLINLAITVVFDEWFAAHGQPVGDGLRRFFLALNLGVSALVVFGFAAYFVSSAIEQRERADALVMNMLPRSIAQRLKRGQTVADHYDSASVLFADMVGSTPLFAEMSPEEAVDWLNEVFTTFDALVDRHGVEKIRTIGDGYMVAAGVPDRRPDHAQALVALALDMIDALEALPPRDGKRMRFRFGIHSGPLVAGVIGNRKLQYDLWGDTVNVAARMESHGEVGRLHVSDETWTALEGLRGERRDDLPVKGRGTMTTWFVSR